MRSSGIGVTLVNYKQPQNAKFFKKILVISKINCNFALVYYDKYSDDYG